MKKISAQEFADSVVSPEFRQPLKTLAECLDIHGWPHEDFPVCCGQKVDVRSMFGDAYFAQCKVCGKFAVDVTGPSFGNSFVAFIDPKKVDIETPRLWIAGIQHDVKMDEESA